MSEIPIIMYHSVNDHPEACPLGFLSISSAEFRQHLNYFRRNGFTCPTLSELWQMAVNGLLDGRKRAVLTFDDGYLDNLHIAAPILADYGFKATVFVNPDFADDAPAREKTMLPDSWGNLNYAEMRTLQDSGVFEIQSHSMTHNFEFNSDKIIDFYTPEKFHKYYWLAWKLYPEQKPHWCQKLREHRDRLPVGYPIFEYGRTITSRAFIPTESFIEHAIISLARDGFNAIDRLNAVDIKGAFETEQQWLQRVKYELVNSKAVIEKKLGAKVNFICFPGGAYNEKVLDIAQSAGYAAYMVASRKRYGSNVQKLETARNTKSIVGLLRTSFTKDYPSLFKGNLLYYLNCKLKMDAYQGKSWAEILMNVFRTSRRFLEKLRRL